MLPVSTRNTLKPITWGTCPAGVSTTLRSTNTDARISAMAAPLKIFKNQLFFMVSYLISSSSRDFSASAASRLGLRRLVKASTNRRAKVFSSSLAWASSRAISA